MIRALVLAALLVTSLAAQANVLLIVADDLGVDHVGCYQEGNDLPATPTLDAMAAGGILFRNAWAYPSCSPSRAAILTGRHPCRTMVGRWIYHELNSNPAIGTLQPREDTLPELLDRAGTGHTTACIGKWHLHDQTFPATTPQTIGGFGHYTGFLAGQLPSYFAWPRVENGVEQTCTVYATTQQTNDALAWIQAQTQPWVCLLTYNAPHLPMQIPPSTLHNRVLTASSSNRQKYLATIEALDHEIGRLLTTLGPTRLANTHVFFVGDNGSIQNFAVPPFLGNRAKGTPYEGGINVPLLYKGPAAVAPGREVQHLACVVDVFATVLDLLGAGSQVPPWLTIDGASLVPVLASPTAGPVRTFAFSEEFTGDAWPAPNTNGHAIVRNDRYKLIHRYGGTHELFDLQADPWEQVNLLSAGLTAAQQQAYAALLGEIVRMRTPVGRCVPFGAATCAGSAGVPSVGCSPPPRIGLQSQLQLAGASASSVSLLAVGFSHTHHGATPLPLDLALFGAGPGCKQWFSYDVGWPAVTSANGAAAWSLAVPNVPALVETTLFTGAYVLDAAAPQNPLGIVSTQPIALVIGL